MKKIVLTLLWVIVLALSLVGCSGDTQEEPLSKAEKSVISENNEKEEVKPEIELTEEEKRFITAGSEEPIWVQDKLYELAVNELGEKYVENVAADATTVKFLLTEPNPDNAALVQYAILYRMKDDYNMTVKFVFYRERGNVQSAYLRSTFNADTLASFDWDTVHIHNLKDYADKYNQF